MTEFMNEVNGLFFHNGLIIVIGCTIVGLFLKGTFKKLPNKFIPYINMVISIALGFIIPDTLSDKDTVTKVVELAFLGLSSTGLYEALCILVKKRFSIDIPGLVKKYTGVDTPTPEDVDADQAIEVISEIVDIIGEGKGDSDTASTDETESQDDGADESDVEESDSL